jgi:hypothetical protein
MATVGVDGFMVEIEASTIRGQQRVRVACTCERIIEEMSKRVDSLSDRVYNHIRKEV